MLLRLFPEACSVHYHIGPKASVYYRLRFNLVFRHEATPTSLRPLIAV